MELLTLGSSRHGLTIDNATLVHVGASLNCLSKRFSAFLTIDIVFIPDIKVRSS